MTNTTNSGFWQDGQVFLSPNGSTTEPIITTKNSNFWQDGQVWEYPFQNTSSSPGRMPIQLMIVTVTTN